MGSVTAKTAMDKSISSMRLRLQEAGSICPVTATEQHAAKTAVDNGVSSIRPRLQEARVVLPSHCYRTARCQDCDRHKGQQLMA